MTNNNFSFTINENYNYYTIRQKARDRYYKQMKEDGWKYGDIKTMMADEMSACCGWKEAEEIALSLNTTETIQQFYDKIQETDYNGIVPPKKWLNFFLLLTSHFLMKLKVCLVLRLLTLWSADKLVLPFYALTTNTD